MSEYFYPMNHNNIQALVPNRESSFLHKSAQQLYDEVKKRQEEILLSYGMFDGTGSALEIALYQVAKEFNLETDDEIA